MTSDSFGRLNEFGRWKNQDRDEQGEGHDRTAPKVIDMARSRGNTHHRVYHAPDTNEGFVIDECESVEGIQEFYGSREFQDALLEAIPTSAIGATH